MGAFEYTAVDPAGKQHRGILEGDTPRQVRQQLRDKNLRELNEETLETICQPRTVFTLTYACSPATPSLN